MAISSLGLRKVLLTEAEARCYQTARVYQRKNLVKKLLQIRGSSEFGRLLRLRISGNPLLLLLQLIVMTIVFPFAFLWLLGRKLIELLAFPYIYLKTFFIPNDLAAPGEKSLVGVHNAFARYLEVGVEDYICCMSDWVSILYGEDALKRINMEGFFAAEMARLKAQQDGATPPDISPMMRNMVGNAREKISRRLGHYSQVNGKPANKTT